MNTLSIKQLLFVAVLTTVPCIASGATAEGAERRNPTAQQIDVAPDGLHVHCSKHTIVDPTGINEAVDNTLFCLPTKLAAKIKASLPDTGCKICAAEKAVTDLIQARDAEVKTGLWLVAGTSAFALAIATGTR